MTPPESAAAGRRRAFWAVLFAALVTLLWLLQSALPPFIAAFVLAYLLDPVVHRLERLGVRRWAATLLIVALALFLLVLLFAIIAPPLAGQFASLLDRLPDYAAQLQRLINATVGGWVTKLGGWERFGINPPGSGDQSAGDLIGPVVGWLVGFARSLASGGQALTSFASLVVVAPIVAIYLLIDWRRMIAALDGWTPLADRARVRRIAREANNAVAAALRGQATVCLFLAIWYGVGLMLVGLNFGFVIGAIGGLLTIIPYLGAIIAFALALLVAIVQFWPVWTSVGLVVLVFVTGQFLEGYVLTPKVVGEAVGLHPLWLMFAVFAFGSLFGFAGVLLALPMAAATGVLARHALRAYLASDIYLADAPDSAT
ncbi:AI-2E family transporter [Terrarubrum flagellatum]|uniref:AI-2E family transporter n=1 Tax=Terrirubrum flagellatum TaxID=2895980 RepID=UPI003144F7E3